MNQSYRVNELPSNSTYVVRGSIIDKKAQLRELIYSGIVYIISNDEIGHTVEFIVFNSEKKYIRKINCSYQVFPSYISMFDNGKTTGKYFFEKIINNDINKFLIENMKEETHILDSNKINFKFNNKFEEL
jgi:hypothetical protein